ncbi:hypothetical protein BHM03_00028892 [Ensete ventricosum]|nr:hypothetical protein BHM03_00028892 [Ensete ventricosum]
MLLLHSDRSPHHYHTTAATLASPTATPSSVVATPSHSHSLICYRPPLFLTFFPLPQPPSNRSLLGGSPYHLPSPPHCHCHLCCSFFLPTLLLPSAHIPRRSPYSCHTVAAMPTSTVVALLPHCRSPNHHLPFALYNRSLATSATTVALLQHRSPTYTAQSLLAMPSSAIEIIGYCISLSTIEINLLLGNLSGCITCAEEIKTKTGFSRKSNCRAKYYTKPKR